MRTLYLLRHAMAVNPGNVSDIDRELDTLGINESEEMGDRIKAAGIIPDIILASNAVRATETAQIVARRIGHTEGALKQEPKLYESPEEAYLDVIQNTDDKVQTLMIVGHNPAISNLAVSLAKDFTESLPTAGLIAIDFDIESWHNVGNHRGRRGIFVFPGQGPDMI